MSAEFCQNTFSEIQNLMGDKGKGLVDTYLSNAQHYIDTILRGVYEGDYSAVEDAAHPLNASSAILGMIRVSDIAQAIEQLCRSKGVEIYEDVDLQKNVEALLVSFKNVQDFCENYNQ